MDQLDLRLYLVTSASAQPDVTSFLNTIEKALAAGVTLVQLRQKPIDGGAFYAIGQQVKALTDAANVPLIIDDRVDVALALDAAGVHVGQSDLPAAVVRDLIGPDKWLGVSVKTVAQAQAARDAGADYLGVGAMFATQTKVDADQTSFDTLKAITSAVQIPVVAIGGITPTNTAQFANTSVAGVAVVSAIMGAQQPMRAVDAFKTALTAIGIGGDFDGE